MEVNTRKICERWVLAAFRVRVKFVIPDDYKAIYLIDLEANFLTMCNIYYMFNKNVVDMMVNAVEGTI